MSSLLLYLPFKIQSVEPHLLEGNLNPHVRGCVRIMCLNELNSPFPKKLILLRELVIEHIYTVICIYVGVCILFLI